MGVQIPPVPKSDGQTLINHINDRLRRISEQLGIAASTGGANGTNGTNGINGTSGAGAGPTYPVPVAGGVATPDASQATNLLVLTENTSLARPINIPVSGVNAAWILIILQGTGPAIPDPANTGLNDAASGGIYPYTPGDTPGGAPGGIGHVYAVKISATGTPDHFEWSKDGGAFSAAIAIDGTAQPLADGITVEFIATTGHTAADQWSIQVGGFTLDVSLYAQLPYGLSNAQSPAGTECIQGFSSSTAGTRCPTPAQMNLPIT